MSTLHIINLTPPVLHSSVNRSLYTERIIAMKCVAYEIEVYYCKDMMGAIQRNKFRCCSPILSYCA